MRKHDQSYSIYSPEYAHDYYVESYIGTALFFISTVTTHVTFERPISFFLLSIPKTNI